MTSLQLNVIKFISSLSALTILTLIAIILDVSLGFLGLRFHMASIGVLLGAYFLHQLDNKILKLLLNQLKK